MLDTEPSSSQPRVGRRNLLAGFAAAGLGALIATEVAGASPSGSATAQPVTVDQKLQHLLRRAGFGASPTELDLYRPLGVNGTVNRLINYQPIDNSALDRRLTQHNLDLTKAVDLERWWLLRMIYTARPLEEKMTLFWHGLLTSAVSKVGMRWGWMLNQNNFLRTNALARFPDILKGISSDPAMMVWLDLETNRKGHANENYARELMELFSLGIGNYTEQDVRESARAFTGWSIDRNRQFFFNRRQHDTGSKTFLGQTGNFDGNNIIDLIVGQPASAHFITNKLFSFFAYPNPSADVLQPLIDVYKSSSYSIKAVVQAILLSDALYSPAAYRGLVKSPAEYVAGVPRMLGLETDVMGVPYAMTQMGQQLFNPPNVAGWPGGAAWLSSGTWLARLNFANRVAALTKQVQTGATPDQIVEHTVTILLDGQIDPAQRQVLVDYVTPANRASLQSAGPAWIDEHARGLLYLTLAMPEFHLG